MNLYLLRHEKRDLNNPTFYSPLLEVGLENADKLKYLLNKLNINLIFSSPFIRVLQTIEPYCIMKNKKVNREFGLYENIDINDNDTNQFKFDKNNFRIDVKKDDDKYYLLNEDYNSIVNLEEINYNTTIENRVDKFINKIIEQYKDTIINILIVTHQSIINTILKRNFSDEYPMGQVCQVIDLNNRSFQLIK